MFIRFVVGNDDEHHTWLTGIITEARILRDSNLLEMYQVERLEGIYLWLNENIPCPPFSTSNWSRNAISWFKDDAGECIQKMWEIVSLLKEHDVPVRMLLSKNPGKTLYEDKYQIVVEEYKEL